MSEPDPVEGLKRLAAELRLSDALLNELEAPS